MIINGWADWAVRRDGPSWKAYPYGNYGLGIVWHSMEGWLSGSLAELDKPSRYASWMFSLDLDGTLYQHYPVNTSCWASGNEFANVNWWSCELSGVQSMPINPKQLSTALSLISEWESYSGLQAYRSGDPSTQTMHEHREVDTISTPNAGPTACPSGRYTLLWEALIEKENEMTNEQLNKIVQDLNAAMVKRMALMEVGAGDYERMLKSYDTLKAAGLIL